MKRLGTVVILCLLIVGQAGAHVPYFEQEMVRRVGHAQPDEDFSFQNPFVIEGDIEESRAVFAYLHRGDVDVYEFTVTPDQIGFDPVTRAPTPLVSATALPPACRGYRRAYPVTALMGPALPPPPPDVDLPFEVPPGYGVVYAANPRVFPSSSRPVFHFPEGDYAWFLPEGLTEHCLLNAPWTCDFTNTINVPIFVPGKYRLIMWNPTGRPMDYTANIGFKENLLSDPADTDEKVAARSRAEALTPQIERFKMLRIPCRPVAPCDRNRPH